MMCVCTRANILQSLGGNVKMGDRLNKYDVVFKSMTSWHVDRK